MTTTLMVSAALIVGGFGVFIRWSRRRRTLAAADGRESLDADVIYERYYAESSFPKATVVELWHEVAETLKVPATKLRPEDRFGREIGSYWIVSDDLDVLAAKGRERAKALRLVVDFEKLDTVDAYIRALAKW